MEKFYLELPSLERKEDALDYLNEHKKYNSEMNGSGRLNHVNEDYIYEEWLIDVTKGREKEYAESIGKVPSNTYFTVRESDKKIIGMFNLRHYLNDYLKKVGGHIGYGIRPTERRKGYAKLQLYFALLEAKKLGLDKVMVDCVITNIGSEKTIKALGGVFSEEVYDEKLDEKLKNYWINVDESIEKYSTQYSNFILKR